ncbi:hypothetical protein [Cesiribacter sp. SM1]|uniref:hypothetical protein n=1 Tax=Cesiribacter sp. SM1 TaxID=2861196 RepID=UPI001CD6389A|nr:hypothetical protein [Cesiribacter sp. SM1]
MKHMFLLAVAFVLLPFAVLSQTADSVTATEGLTPFTRGITFGFELWPITKERVRLGYHWEWKPNMQWNHELAYFNAAHGLFAFGQDEWWEDNYGNLHGVQLKNELRIYHRRTEPAFWYHGASIAYLYSEHNLVKGFECEDNGWSGGCAYFRNFRPLQSHTATLAGNFGLVLTTHGILHFNFFSSLGLRGTYFPLYRSEGYFGKNRVIAKSEHFALEPYLHLGVNFFFTLSKRKDPATGLQNQ